MFWFLFSQGIKFVRLKLETVLPTVDNSSYVGSAHSFLIWAIWGVSLACMVQVPPKDLNSSDSLPFGIVPSGFGSFDHISFCLKESKKMAYVALAIVSCHDHKPLSGQSHKDGELNLCQSAPLNNLPAYVHVPELPGSCFLHLFHSLWLLAAGGLVFWELIPPFQKRNIFILYFSFTQGNSGSFFFQIFQIVPSHFFFFSLGLH